MSIICGRPAVRKPSVLVVDASLASARGGSALIDEGVIEPLELGHLPYRKKTFADYVSAQALEPAILAPPNSRARGRA